MNLFVYGTLTFPEILFILTKKRFKEKSIIIKGYGVFHVVKNGIKQPYPTIIVQKNKFTEGKILYNVDEVSWKILEAYEGDEYLLKELNISINSKKRKLKTYVLKEQNPSKDFVWSKEEFRKEYLQHYLQSRIPDFLSGHS